ncbi:hypothetical protein ABAC460_14095 [Asticcacaulis sp. AC460]|uniref:glycosyltransferase family 61 protein n=1 Tax=Asticcacaulis sp. AC460 TaxID=1282360 RepID=UPI0003C401AA|nr:glycosyltransferase family 61 protein [Asticcacaulis sp. AC460]ESQ88908.1 hypothetical protein ABAC460_14095 [Asticcacaulis sp. AC460]
MIKCDVKWGEDAVKSGDPQIVLLHDAVFMPNGERFGIFDSEGRIVPAAIDFRTPQLLSKQSLAARIELSEVTQTAPDVLYIYCGYMNPHFGHFLINTLSRFWDVAYLRGMRAKFVYHGVDIAAMYSLPFVRAIFEAMGLIREDFVTFDTPTRLSNLIVPDTSFQEQRAGFTRFRDLCLDLGRKLSPKSDAEPNERPIYYSKSRLQSGVGGFDNEAEFETVMAGLGVDIVYPETLSLAEQIRLLNSRSLVFGTAGSFLHNTIFCESDARFVILNPSLQINTNFTIIDKLTGSDVTYYYPEDMQVLPSEDRKGFLTLRSIPNARARAEELFSLAGAGTDSVPSKARLHG